MHRRYLPSLVHPRICYQVRYSCNPLSYVTFWWRNISFLYSVLAIDVDADLKCPQRFRCRPWLHWWGLRTGMPLSGVTCLWTKCPELVHVDGWNDPQFAVRRWWLFPLTDSKTYTTRVPSSVMLSTIRATAGLLTPCGCRDLLAVDACS